MSFLTIYSQACGQTRGKTEAGVRLGVFVNSQNQVQVPDARVKLYPDQVSLYVEGFFNYNFTKSLAAVLNLGTYSKGDISFDLYYNGVFDGSFIGQATVFPMQLGLKFSPLGNKSPKVAPYLAGGGAIIIGRETVTLGPYDSYYFRYGRGYIGSETDLNWWGACGAEIPLSNKLNLDILVKYINTNFSGDIAGIWNYSGWQITAGIGYLNLRKKH